jgi:hypothetical protein
MDKQWRSTGLFAAGAIAGGALAVAAYLGWFSPRPPPPSPASPVAAAPPSAVTPPAPAVAVQPVAAASTCPAQPLAVASDDRDGRFALEPVLGKGNHADASAFLAVAKEATGAGRLRDAEVALLAAFHVAEQANGGASAPLADVKSQLGQHYVLLAAREDTEAAREGLLQRASDLFSDSAGAYAAALGRNASKTRLAEERLAAVRSPETLSAALQPQPEPPTTTMGAAPEIAPRRSAVPLLVNSDPELAQLEHDMQRLRAQAESISRDRAGMQQRDAQALAARDARCQDKACLLRWYAQRRAQLLDEF